MPVTNDWMFDYTGTTSLDAVPTLQHIDGRVSYDGRTAGTAPSLGDYVRFTNSGAVAKVIGGDDLGGTNASGYLDLTNVVGLIEDNDPFEVLSEVPFDTVANGGFDLGDTLDDGVSAAITVRAIEYNIGTTDGQGTIYGDTFTAGFANNDAIELGATQVATVNGTEVDHSSDTWDGQTAGQLAPPGTANTNNAVIIHYDAGSIAIPHGAKIADTTGLTGAYGWAQRVYGDTATGSVYVIDCNQVGASWVDNNTLYIHDVVVYNNLVAGKVFQVGDVLKGETSTEEGRVIAVIEDTSTTGKIILAGKTGAFTNLETIQRLLSDDSYEDVADVNGTTDYLAAATMNIPAGNPVITTQRASEGGIYGAGSLNIVRDMVEVASHVMGTMDDLLQLDDKSIVDGQVKDQLYIIKDDWRVPDLSWQYVETGGVQDEGGNNVFTNIKSSGSIFGVGNHGFFLDATNPSPPSSIYLEQDDGLIPRSWLPGHINILVKKRTKTHPKYINPTVEGLGQLIDSGNVTAHCREYLRTFASASDDTVGGVAPVFLQTSDDLSNETGQYQFAYNTGSGSFTVGEEITTGSGNGLKVGIVTADSGTTTGNVSYVLKSGTQFSAAEVVTGVVSEKSATLTGTVTNLVAGYGTDIRTMVMTDKITGGTSSGTWVVGDLVTQATTGATGYFLKEDADALYLEKVNATAFSGNNNITGALGGTYTAGTLVYTTPDNFPDDIGDGANNNYTAKTGANITNASAQTIDEVYEWHKHLTCEESTFGFKTAGDSTVETEGRFFRKLNASFSESADCPLGSFPGASKYFAAQGLFIDKDTLATTDIQKISLKDNAGTTEIPPNVQPNKVTGLAAGINFGLYRSTGVGSVDPLTTEFQVGSGNGAGNSSIVLQAGTRSVSPTPKDVPDTGVLRIEDPNNAGIFLRFPYSSVNRTTNTYTLTSGTIGDVTGGTALTQADSAFVVFLEQTATGAEHSKNVEYVAPFYTVAIARKKGKKPFTGTGQFTDTGGQIGAVFNNDPSVNLP